MSDVMIDLETLGTSAGCVILSIGAVRFGRDGISETFEARIDLASSLGCGHRIDAGTLAWWAGQSDAARKVLTEPGGENLVDALTRFGQWLRPESLPRVWGNGASFDLPILDAAYRSAGLKTPWRGGRDDRCYRTLKNLRPDVPLTVLGVKHSALDDARSQAHHAIALLNALDGWEDDRFAPPAQAASAAA